MREGAVEQLQERNEGGYRKRKVKETKSFRHFSIVCASLGACRCEMRENLTDSPGRNQRSFLHGEVASVHQFHKWGQEQERKDADHIHDADRQQQVIQVKV